MREIRKSGSMRGCRKRAFARRACVLLYACAATEADPASIEASRKCLLRIRNIQVYHEPMKENVRTRSRRKLFAAALLSGAGATALSGQTKGEWTPKKQSVGGPIRSGHLLFLSGIGGWYPERRPKAGDIREQTADALTIMKDSLEKAGSSMQNVLKVQVALVDPEMNWEPMNEVYNTFFPKEKPVRSYFGSTGFRRRGQLLQIDCIAYVD